jgi:hypothetical protein
LAAEKRSEETEVEQSGGPEPSVSGVESGDDPSNRRRAEERDREQLLWNFVRISGWVGAILLIAAIVLLIQGLAPAVRIRF